VTIKGLVEGFATTTLAICAVVVTAIVVRRELVSPADPRGPRAPVQVRDWRRYAVSDEHIGSLNAPVTVLVFSDFECPFCKRLSNILRSIQRTHPGDFAEIHRNFPIGALHPHAWSAAAAAECAAAQDRFAPYHDLLFQRQDSLGAVSWTRLASLAGVHDLTAFSRCLKDQRVAGVLARDSVAAEALHIKGTPLVLVNGWLFDGLPPEQELEDLIVREARSAATVH